MVNYAWIIPFNLLHDFISQTRTDAHSGGGTCLRSGSGRAVQFRLYQPDRVPLPRRDPISCLCPAKDLREPLHISKPDLPLIKEGLFFPHKMVFIKKISRMLSTQRWTIMRNVTRRGKELPALGTCFTPRPHFMPLMLGSTCREAVSRGQGDAAVNVCTLTPPTKSSEVS